MAGVDGSELLRKTLHVAMGGLALLLAWVPPVVVFLLALAALAHNLFLLPRYAPGLTRDDRRFDAGILLYPAVIAVLVLLFARRIEVVAVAWGAMAFGDGFATIIGRPATGGVLPWNPDKTWAGFIAFVLFGGAGCLFLFHWVEGGVLGPFDPVEPTAALGVPWGFWWIPVMIAVIVAAFVESLPLKVNDNLSVPLAAAGVLWMLLLFDPAAWEESRPAVLAALPWAIGLNAALGYSAFDLRVFTRSGVVTGALLGSVVFAFGGWRSFAVMVAFIALATGATMLGFERKRAEGIAQEAGGIRSAGHALANCGFAAVLAALSSLSQLGPVALVGLAGAFATACADTASSEVGRAYARDTVLITSFRRVRAGTPGGVSLVGTFAGAAGAAGISALAWALGLIGTPESWVVLAAAMVGMFAESYLGAALKEKDRIDHDVINFANTVIGGLAAMGLARFLLGPA